MVYNIFVSFCLHGIEHKCVLTQMSLEVDVTLYISFKGQTLPF